MISSEKSLNLGELSKQCCLQAWILWLAINTISCFSWNHRLHLFSRQYLPKIQLWIPTVCLSIILSGKNGGPWIRMASAVHMSNDHTSDFFVKIVTRSRRALMFFLFHHRILKRPILKGWDVMKLAFLEIH